MKKLIIILFLFFFAACNLLETRDVEAPDNIRSKNRHATTPEILFENLKSSFSEKIVENYIACFVDKTFLDKNFLFVSATEAFIEVTNWQVQSERQYFLNLKSVAEKDSPILLKLSRTNYELKGDSADYYFDYELKINTKDERIVDVLKGTSYFKVYLDSRQQWVIVAWKDFKIKGYQCWSDLKKLFY